jgi:hypothetical protein
MTKLYCVENLIFYEEIQIYKFELNKDQRMIRSKEIYDNFFLDDSPYQLNITKGESKYVFDRLIFSTIDLFDKLYKVNILISLLLSIESFVLTDTYKEMFYDLDYNQNFIY